MTTPTRSTLAVLIDADNVPARLVERLLVHARRLGDVALARAYGNWSAQRPEPWRRLLGDDGLRPPPDDEQRYRKNGADIALTIDAMDLLHDGAVQGFLIASGDSDFTRLALRIRQAGLFVAGVGNPSTPAGFRSACHTFTWTDTLTAAAGKTPPGGPPPAWVRTVRHAFQTAPGKRSGWLNLAMLGQTLQRTEPNFRPRHHGHPTLRRLLASRPDLFALRRDTGATTYVRLIGAT